MTHQAIWRGCEVKVLSADGKTAVIVTPCAIVIEVRAIELSEIDRKKREKLDSSKF